MSQSGGSFSKLGGPQAKNLKNLFLLKMGVLHQQNRHIVQSPAPGDLGDSTP